VGKSATATIPLDHERILDIVEFFPDATFVIDTDKNIIAWNRAIEMMTGVNKEQMIGKGNQNRINLIMSLKARSFVGRIKNELKTALVVC
jgi:PAS domain S-box-containing protein